MGALHERLQPLASVARAPLFEVRGVRFTHSPYWHTSVTVAFNQNDLQNTSPARCESGAMGGRGFRLGLVYTAGLDAQFFGCPFTRSFNCDPCPISVFTLAIPSETSRMRNCHLALPQLLPPENNVTCTDKTS